MYNLIKFTSIRFSAKFCFPGNLISFIGIPRGRLLEFIFEFFREKRVNGHCKKIICLKTTKQPY